MLSDCGFWQDFFANFLSDLLVGAALGTALALWLDKRQRKEQDRKEEQAREQEALLRKAKILRLLRSELEYNHDQLLESETETDGIPKRVVFVNGLRDELWSAFSDGGELEWIRDLQLLHDISLAYHYIRRIIYLEKIYLEIRYYPGTPSAYPVPPQEELIRRLRQLDPDAKSSIEEALTQINTSLVYPAAAATG